MSSERVALNLRLPASLHQGLVELAQREYRSLNDQMVFILSRYVLAALDPKPSSYYDRLAALVAEITPFIDFWVAEDPGDDPETLRQTARIAFRGLDQRPPEEQERLLRRIADNYRLQRALVELVHAFNAAKTGGDGR